VATKTGLFDMVVDCVDDDGSTVFQDLPAGGFGDIFVMDELGVGVVSMILQILQLG
jgi:hypothetical protein